VSKGLFTIVIFVFIKEFLMKIKYLLSCLAATAAFASGSAQAAYTVYSDFSTVSALTDYNSPLVTDNFNGTVNDIGVGGSTGYSGPATSYNGLGSAPYPQPSGINYSSASDMYLIDKTYTEAKPGGGNYFFVGFGFEDSLVAYGTGAGGSKTMTITAPAGSFGVFGVDLGAVDAAGSYTVAINGGGAGNTFTGPSTMLANPTGSYLGIVSTSPITSVSITSSTGRFSVDNVVFGTSVFATAPEPSSVALLGLGLAALGWKSRRKSAV
jgi:hypothetical protein